MDLKVFHVFFIYASMVLAAGFGGWCVTHDRLWMGIASFALSGGLIWYVGFFARKVTEKHL